MLFADVDMLDIEVLFVAKILNMKCDIYAYNVIQFYFSQKSRKPSQTNFDMWLTKTQFSKKKKFFCVHGFKKKTKMSEFETKFFCLNQKHFLDHSNFD